MDTKQIMDVIRFELSRKGLKASCRHRRLLTCLLGNAIRYVLDGRQTKTDRLAANKVTESAGLGELVSEVYHQVNLRRAKR